MKLADLQDAVRSAAAFRCRTRLQPVGGDGTKVFPPTYSGGVYAWERRRIDGKEVPCVLLDTVQSQANRFEESLRVAWEEGRLTMPMILTDFSDVSLPDDVGKLVRESVHQIGEITTLDAPHRIADAIMRDSVTADGMSFREKYERAFDANIRNATALFELCPTALLFGTWDSQGSRGGLGNKFARALVSEIVGINAVAGVRTSSRIDPLGISKNAGPVYRAKNGDWTLSPEDAIDNGKGMKQLYKKQKGKVVWHDPAAVTFADQGKPSVANHGNVTPGFAEYSKGARGIDPLKSKQLELETRLRRNEDHFDVHSHFHSEQEAREKAIAAGGVTLDWALQTTVLSLPALRRLRFPESDGKQNSDRNSAARTVLAALGLVALVEQWNQGYFLRSRCDLVAESSGLVIERVTSASTSEDEQFSLAPSQAIALFDQTVQDAKQHGLSWDSEPIRLTPKSSLVEMVCKSRELELAGETETEDEGDE